MSPAVVQSSGEKGGLRTNKACSRNILLDVALQQCEIRALWQKRRTRELTAAPEVEKSYWRPCQRADVACDRSGVGGVLSKHEAHSRKVLLGVALGQQQPNSYPPLSNPTHTCTLKALTVPQIQACQGQILEGVGIA